MKYKNYEIGEKIETLDELFNQDFIFLREKLYHKGWFVSWPLRLAKLNLNYGIYKVIRKDIFDE